MVGSLSTVFNAFLSPLLELRVELQAQVLLDAAICKGFPKGAQIPGRWSLTCDQYVDTCTQTPDLQPWQLWTSGLYGNRLSVVSACPMQGKLTAVNYLNLWPCRFLRGHKPLRPQPHNSLVDVSNFINLTKSDQTQRNHKNAILYNRCKLNLLIWDVLVIIYMLNLLDIFWINRLIVLSIIADKCKTCLQMWVMSPAVLLAVVNLCE